MSDLYHLVIEHSSGNRVIISTSDNKSYLETIKAGWEYQEEQSIRMHFGPSPLPPKRKFIIVQEQNRLN